MQKLKRNKRLTLAVIAFMLTFVVGAAFATTPGALQAVGVIGVGDGDLHVRWVANSAVPTANPTVAIQQGLVIAGANIGTPAGQPDQPTMGNHNAQHRAQWNIGFIDDGTVVLTVVAENVGSLPALVHAPGLAPAPQALLGGLAWFEPGILFTDPFTVTGPVITAHTAVVPPPGGNTFPFPLEPTETVTVQFTVNWDGTGSFAPSGGVGALDWPNILGGPGTVFGTGGFLYDFDWANSFVMSLPYTAQ